MTDVFAGTLKEGIKIKKGLGGVVAFVDVPECEYCTAFYGIAEDFENGDAEMDEGEADVELGKVEGKKIRLNLDKSLDTTLLGTKRVAGSGWMNDARFLFEGVHFQNFDRLVLFSKGPNNYLKNFVLGLAVRLESEEIKNELIWQDAVTRNASIKNNQVEEFISGTFGGPDLLSFGERTLPFDSGTLEKVDFGHDSDPVDDMYPGCAHPIRFELTITQIAFYNGPPPPPILNGVGICRNGTVFRVENLQGLNLHVEEALESVNWLAIFAHIQLLVAFRYMFFIVIESVGTRMDRVATISIGTVSFMALTNLYVLEVFANALPRDDSGMWVMVIPMKVLEIVFCHVLCVLSILHARTRLEGATQNRRNFYVDLCRAQTTAAVCMLVFQGLRESHPTFLALVWVSLWVPQIALNAWDDVNEGFPLTQSVYIMSVSHAIWPVTALLGTFVDVLASADIIGSHEQCKVHHPFGALLVVGWLGVQLYVLRMQKTRGPQFFFPKRFRAQRFDYRVSAIEAGVGNEDHEEIECVVCMSVVTPKDAVRTPCSHVFHEGCIRDWMKVKMACPTCRAKLPPLIIDSVQKPIDDETALQGGSFV